MKDKTKERIENEGWKNKNLEYLFELQKFLDLADNIKDDKIRSMIINQMIKIDRILNTMLEEKNK